MGYQQILTERHDDVLLLTLRRPERMSAWTPRMMAELTDAVSLANDDDSVGAIVVTGRTGAVPTPISVPTSPTTSIG